MITATNAGREQSLKTITDAFLKLAGVGTNICQIVGSESDAMTKLLEELEELEHSE